MQFRQLLDELKQRHLYRVALIYAAAVWLLVQAADIVAENFDWPQWLMQGLLVVAVLGLPVALIICWFFEGGNSSDEARSLPLAGLDPESRPSIVVLPFDCFSDLPDDAWATDALTEDLTTLIARIPGFSVIARNTAFTFKGRSVDVREVGSDLGVRYLLEGSVRRLP